MKTFKDANGKDWSITVTVGSALRVRELCGIELLKLDDELFNQLADPIKLVGVLYALCKPAADVAGVTPEQFGEGLCGDAIELATDAVMGAVADFFPSRRRKVFEKLAATVKGIEDLQLKKAEMALENPDMERLLTDHIQKQTSGGLSASSPESSVSIPAPSVSAT